MIMQNESRKRVTFEIEAPPGSDVYIAGSFNSWDPLKRRLKYEADSNTHSVTMLLDRGLQYEYKYVIDGYWSLDPNNDEIVSNNQGSLNSVLVT